MSKLIEDLEALITLARQHHAHAVATEKAAREALEQAQRDRWAASDAIQRAIERRDRALPQAEMIDGGGPEHLRRRLPVCIVKRAPKTITARRIGLGGDIKFRLRDGVWREFPDCYAARTLVVSDGGDA